MALEEIRSERIKKLKKLTDAGNSAYPADAKRTHTIREILSKFSILSRAKKKISAVGRVRAVREHGGSTFLDIEDGTGKLQFFAKEDLLKEAYGALGETIDVGDFIEGEGNLFKTKRGEETLELLRWRILSKSLRPLPEKWHGLQDVEERFRKRYLDTIMNEEIRARFRIRAQVISIIRTILEKNDFLEFETPMLHHIPGGALAKPFITHQNALNIDLYLRVAPELFLKRLLVGGFERVFEIGKNFRNEGVDATHNPEFTMLECYAAYWNEEDMMKFTELAVRSAIKEATGKHEIEYEAGQKLDFKKPFGRIAFRDILSRYALITNYDGETRESLATRARQFGIDAEPTATKGKIADEIFKKICRPRIIQPTFVIHHPLDISPLAKRRDANSEEVRRFQLIVAGLELANGFSELNDPLDQRARFEEQDRIRKGTFLGGGDDEAHRIDEEYIEAMEYGMPPAAGLGIGIDRLVMLITGTKNVREVILFPTMRQK